MDWVHIHFHGFFIYCLIFTWKSVFVDITITTSLDFGIVFLFYLLAFDLFLPVHVLQSWG